jgi:hypothetical protein
MRWAAFLAAASPAVGPGHVFETESGDNSGHPLCKLLQQKMKSLRLSLAYEIVLQSVANLARSAIRSTSLGEKSTAFGSAFNKRLTRPGTQRR